MLGQLICAHRLTGFGTADLYNDFACGLLAEVMVVADHAVDFCAGEVQTVRDQGHRIRGYVAAASLNFVQHGQQGAINVARRTECGMNVVGNLCVSHGALQLQICL